MRAGLCLGLACAWLGACASAPDQPAACPDVATSGTLNLMTLNLLFSEVDDRDERLEAIAEFAADNRVHRGGSPSGSPKLRMEKSRLMTSWRM